jgi:hypothetical protein
LCPFLSTLSLNNGSGATQKFVISLVPRASVNCSLVEYCLLVVLKRTEDEKIVMADQQTGAGQVGAGMETDEAKTVDVPLGTSLMRL